VEVTRITADSTLARVARLAIATPSAILSGIARAARSRVLVKGGAALEQLGAVRALAFDKTGTLTEGKFGVTDVMTLNGASEQDVLKIAGAVEQQSNHPLAQAIVRAAKERKLDLPTAGALENVPGKGVRSSVGGKPVLIGALKLFDTVPQHRSTKSVYLAGRYWLAYCVVGAGPGAIATGGVLSRGQHYCGGAERAALVGVQRVSV
jgi:cation transport ATPase